MHRRALIIWVLGLSACSRTVPPTFSADAGNVIVEAPPAHAPAPGPAPLRRLTRDELDATVRQLLHTTRPVASALPFEQGRVFSTAAEGQSPSTPLTQRWLDLTEALAAEADLAAALPCAPDDACLPQVLNVFGRRAFRRPLTAEERARFTDFFTASRTTDDAAQSYRLLLQLFLQSPQFLYRLEVDNTSSTPQLIDGYALATRLAFFLTGMSPDDTLLDAAATGALDTRDGVATQARRLLSSAAAVDVLRRFHREWLGVDRLDTATKAASLGDFETLRPQLADEVGRLGEWATLSDGRFESLFTTRASFLTADLGALYGVPVASDGAFHFTSLATHQRQGVLTLPGVMAAWAKSDETSPVQRGKLIRERVLCQLLPAPPPGVAMVLPPPSTGTTRERQSAHTASPACAGCHGLIDPVGFGFERYDAIGAYRNIENGRPIDVSGEVKGADTELVGTFSGALELSDRLARSSTAQRCYATQWFRFATGRIETDDDVATLDDATSALLQANGLREVLISLAVSDAFRYRGGP